MIKPNGLLAAFVMLLAVVASPWAQGQSAKPDKTATQQGKAAPEVTDPALLSLAAGYKATFTCSSLFNAGRTLEQIAGDELNRIYPDFRAAMAQLPDAVVSDETATVAVTYADGFPPRTAVWTGRRGCMQQPAGSAQAAEGMFDTATMADMNGPIIDRGPAHPVDNGIPIIEPAMFDQSEELSDIIDQAFDRETYGIGTETTAVLIIRDGSIIGERYRDGFDKDTPQRTWSVAKSIAATIIGAAIHQGIISTDDTITLAQWPEWDPRRTIRLANLLHMASGLDNGPAGNRTDEIYWGGGRVIDHATTERLVATPGRRWFYANNDTMIAMRYLREVMDDDQAYQEFPFTALLDRIGMARTFPETDWNGDFVLSSQVYTTARDLGRLGLLHLNDGVWGGERILPEGWVRFVTTPAPSQPPARADGSKRFGYGAQWWLLGGFEGLPEDTFAALGNRGQSLTIIPSRDLIIVRRGFDDNGGNQFNVARFASDVTAVLGQWGTTDTE